MRRRFLPGLGITVAVVLSALAIACGPSPAATPAAVPVSACAATDAAPIVPGWMASQSRSTEGPPSQSGEILTVNIADAVAAVKPSVVVINTETIVYDQMNRPAQELGAGSGWIVDATGLIITNNHVVEGAGVVTVTLDDGRVFRATEVRTDHLSDLAVLKIDADNLPVARVGDASKLKVGDWVVAIGNPLGLGISAKEGIISRFGVSISVDQGQTLHDLIETSAAINPGNSGGPLINLDGEVIGITSAKISSIGIEGMGYAICTRTAIPIIEKLVSVGWASRPWLGIEYISVDQEQVFRHGLVVDKGALVTLVVPDSPAAKAGIAEGDVIVQLQAREIASASDMVQAEQSSSIGQQVAISLWRGDTRSTVTAVPLEIPPCEY